MLNAPALPSNSATMSSLALVDFINVERSSTDKVLRHDHFLDKVLLVLGLDAPKFRGIYIDSMNRERPCYYFRKREACLMAMSYSYELQARVFDYMTKLEENETKPVANLSDASTLRELLLGYTEQVIQLQATVEAQKPAVAFVEKYVESEGSYGFRQVAKLLNIKEPDFRLFLIHNKIMYNLGGGWTAYSEHTEAGRFKPHTGVGENGHNFLTHKFTAKGVEWIAGLMASKQVLIRNAS